MIFVFFASGMESMIKRQKDNIAELEARIQSNLDEIAKVRMYYSIAS